MIRVNPSERGLESARRLLMFLAAATGLIVVGGGFYSFQARGEAVDAEKALAAKVKEKADREAELTSAKQSARLDGQNGLLAVGRLQEEMNRLAARHKMTVTTFQANASVSPFQSLYGLPAASGYGYVQVTVSFTGRSDNTLAALKSLPNLGLAIEIDKLNLTPLQVQPNGATGVGTTMTLRLFTRMAGGPA